MGIYKLPNYSKGKSSIKGEFRKVLINRRSLNGRDRIEMILPFERKSPKFANPKSPKSRYGPPPPTCFLVGMWLGN
jgi:hypothetical protein